MPKLLLLFLLCLSLLGCNENANETITDTSLSCIPNSHVIKWNLALKKDCNKLSSYGLFNSPEESTPQGVLYKLNVSLYSDYLNKYRFVFVPPGKTIKQSSKNNDLLDFPVGSILTKTFSLRRSPQNALSSTNSEQAIETRLLIKNINGWRALTYLWNETQDEAVLTQGGINIPSEIMHEGETVKFTYRIPEQRYCFDCHQNHLSIQPLGPKLKNLNRFKHNSSVNQLNALEALNILELDQANLGTELPAFSNFHAQDFVNISNEELNKLAFAYLDVNCGSCHTPGGMASLFTNLNYNNIDIIKEDQPTIYSNIGVCKNVNFFAKLFGTKNQKVIVPGSPEKSALVERMMATGLARMPAVGTLLPHQEGIALMTEWIQRMDVNCDK